MAGGIKIVGGRHIKIIDCGFAGLDFGIDATDSSDLVIEGNKFENVKSPVKASRINGLKAKNNIDRTSQSFHNTRFRLTAIAYSVRWSLSQL